MKTESDSLCNRCLACLRYSVVERGIRWSLSGIFIYSGLIKLIDPQRFAEVISGFGLLPHAFIFPGAILLSILEVVAGVGLVFSLRGSLAAITGMLVLFMTVLVYGINLGLDIDCGCFGPEDPELAYKGLKTALARDMVMMTGVMFLYWSRGRSRLETGRLEQ
jgi:uncharacterized membrane protein YphA (DoxX/SURF4 family)